MPAVDGTSMADGKNQNENLVVLNVDDYAIISDPISPQASKIARQAFSESPRIVCACNTITHESDNAFLCVNA